VAKIISTGTPSPEDLKQNFFKNIWEDFRSLDKGARFVILSGFFLIIFGVYATRNVLETRQRAGGGLLYRVDINPGQVTAKVDGPSVGLSALAYGPSGEPVWDGVLYEWSMSSTNSVGTLNSTLGTITELDPISVGYGDLHVIARLGSYAVEKSIQVMITNPDGSIPPPPITTPMPTPVGKCTDSDGGKNFDIKGTTKGVSPSTGEIYSGSDTCYTGEDNGFYKKGDLVEHYCDGDYHTNLAYKCPFGCGNGACLVKNSQPLTLQLTPTADSYVRSNQPGKNFGFSNVMWIDGKPKVISYLKFDLRKFSGKEILGAKLRLRVANVTDAQSKGEFLVKISGANWSEKTIKYNNRPPLLSQISKFANIKKNAIVELDFTSFIQANAGNIVSIGIDTGSADGAVIRSKEATSASSRPTLVIEYR